ncbi:MULTISPECIES: hypothetical protein [unclassified Nocardioides]|uniref:hypothetical protein n=1 Tax=unclassified Nocardioides TaxID=2615069 RepID=UPI00360C2B6D
MFIVQHAIPLTMKEHDLLTAEKAPEHTATPAYAAGDVRQGSRARARWVGLLAASLVFLLAFGLLGLLAGLWHLTRGRGSAHAACRSCRRRRDITVAGASALAGLVLVGSGMAVHQLMTGPGLPSCGPETPTRTTAQLDDAIKAKAGGVWRQTREVLTAPVSGPARHYVHDTGGGLCEGDSMTLAFMPSAASDTNFAVGSVVLTGDESGMRENGRWKALASHESRHVTQWATLDLIGGPLAMPVLYSVDEAFYPGSRNHFERAAVLEDGGYSQPEDFGPHPQWVKVAGIGLLLLAIGRRRLRWISRVLTGGALAASARQPGLCPLHSRGWFRLQARSRATGA